MNKNSLQQIFLDLIHIDEIYPNEKEIVEYVLSFFKKLNIPTKADSFGNVIGYISGTGNPVMLSTHLDSPESVPNLDYEVEGDLIRSKGKSILGVDPKSGLAILLEFAKYVKENTIATCPIEFVFTRGEEPGLIGARNLDYSLLKSKMGLVLDEDGPVTSVVVQAPAFYKLDIELVGKSVHPRDWKDGVNALEHASKVIAKLRHGEIVKGVTFNIGIFHAGTARNTTAGIATLQAELRSFDTKKLLKAAGMVEEKFRSLENTTGLNVKIEGGLEFEGYKLSKNHPLFRKLEQTYTELKLKPHYYSTYGGSDSNIFNTKGIRTVAIGSGYYLAHQYTEYVNLKEM